MIRHLLAMACGIGVAAPASADPVQHIQIDAGGVEVELADTPADTPPALSYRAQGRCQPEVDIVRSGHSLQARHLRSCHGTGRNEGTIFTLTVSAHASFALALDAGGVSIRGDLGDYRRVDFSVRVGGIRNYRRDLDLPQTRRMLVGASAMLERPGGDQTMQVRLKYGGISLY